MLRIPLWCRATQPLLSASCSLRTHLIAGVSDAIGDFEGRWHDAFSTLLEGDEVVAHLPRLNCLWAIEPALLLFLPCLTCSPCICFLCADLTVRCHPGVRPSEQQEERSCA